MALRDATPLEKAITQKIRSKMPSITTLKKVLIEDINVILDFGNGMKNDLIFITIDWNAITPVQLLIPRIMFPKFERGYIVSNFKQKRQIDMMRTIGLFYDINFLTSIKQLIVQSQSTNQ